MAEERWARVDDYLDELLVPHDPVLTATLQAGIDAGLPQIQVSPTQGKFLYLLALIQGATRILEIGTLAGYSTIWLARALPRDGRLVSLELEAATAEVARANLRKAGLDSVAEVRVGPALDSLAALADQGGGPFDMVFIDADKENNPGYLAWALRMSRPGTVIVVDNIVRHGAVVDPASEDESVLGVRKMFDQIVAEPRLEATGLQTVGLKGWDGFALLRVKG